MQTKERKSGVRKELVRNVEKKNTKVCVKREFCVDPSILMASIQGPLHGREDILSNITSNIIKRNINDLPKGIGASKDISASMKVINERASKKLNFPFDEVVYQDLIPLNDVKQVSPAEFPKRLNRPRRLRKLDPEPKLDDFYKPEKQNFFVFDYLVKGKDLGIHHRNSLQKFNEYNQTPRYSNFIGKEQKGGDRTRSYKGKTAENAQELRNIRKFKELHVNIGLDRPKRKSYFDGFSLHRKSQAWKV